MRGIPCIRGSPKPFAVAGSSVQRKHPQNGIAHIGLADDVTSAGARIGPKGRGLELFFWGGCGWRPHICRAPVLTGGAIRRGRTARRDFARVVRELNVAATYRRSLKS